MDERISKLKEQVKELLEWKRQNSVQQLPFNPPVNTTNIMHNNHLVVTGKISTTVPFFDKWLEVKLDDKIYVIPAVISTT